MTTVYGVRSSFVPTTAPKQRMNLDQPITITGIRTLALESGKEAAKAVMVAVAAHRQEFEFDHHCSAPDLEAPPKDIVTRIESYSGIRLAEAFAIPDLDREIKWRCGYARQNGIHASPTFMIDGLVQADMSSGDAVSDWVPRLLES